MTGLIYKIQDRAYVLQEMSYPEKFFFFRIARENFLENCFEQKIESCLEIFSEKAEQQRKSNMEICLQQKIGLQLGPTI